MIVFFGRFLFLFDVVFNFVFIFVDIFNLLFFFREHGGEFGDAVDELGEGSDALVERGFVDGLFDAVGEGGDDGEQFVVEGLEGFGGFGGEVIDPHPLPLPLRARGERVLIRKIRRILQIRKYKIRKF